MNETMHTDEGFTYRGCLVWSEVCHEDDDCRKLGWHVQTPDGEVLYPQGPGTYDDTGREVRAWIDAGFPVAAPNPHRPLWKILKWALKDWKNSRAVWRKYRREALRRSRIKVGAP